MTSFGTWYTNVLYPKACFRSPIHPPTLLSYTLKHVSDTVQLSYTLKHVSDLLIGHTSFLLTKLIEGTRKSSLLTKLVVDKTLLIQLWATVLVDVVAERLVLVRVAVRLVLVSGW